MKWNTNWVFKCVCAILNCYSGLEGKSTKKKDTIIWKFSWSIEQADCEIITSNVESQQTTQIPDSNETMRSRESRLLCFPMCCTQTITALVTVTWKLTSEQVQLTHLVQTVCTQDTHIKSAVRNHTVSWCLIMREKLNIENLVYLKLSIKLNTQTTKHCKVFCGTMLTFI